MHDFALKPLDQSTWGDFKELVQRHNGVWGGCWCMGFHSKGEGWGRSADLNCIEKEALVRTGKAHAALVFDGDACVGWCQFGSPDELPRIKHLKAYREGLKALPDWRITCFFVDKVARGKGVARAALAGALDEISALGGGSVEAYPEAVAGRKVSGSFLWGATVEMFEAAGFTRERQLGKNHWVMRRQIG